MEARNRSMTEKLPFQPSFSRPLWWDEECTQITKQRKEKLSNYRTLSNYDNYLEYKNIEAKTKLLFKKKSLDCWVTFINRLNKNTSPTKIWQFMKKISNKNYQIGRTTLHPELIDKLLDNLAPSFAINTPIRINKQNSNSAHEEFYENFTIEEMENVIKLTNSSSPGIDSVTYRMIGLLPLNAKQYLLEIFNDWWLKGEFSNNLKKIIITFIAKPGKDKTLPSSYRPIALMSCLTKVFERMLKLRLELHVEKKNLFPVTQFGFRRGLGTIDALAHIVTDIQNNFSDNTILACFFLDLNILEEKLNHFGIDIKAACRITELYRERQVFVRDSHNNLHGPRFVSQGLPQGSVMSPILFNVYTAELHNMFDNSIKVIQYADDFCIYTVRKSYGECVSDLECIMYCLKNWLTQHGFTLSAEKSCITFFSRLRLSTPNTIRLCGINIPVKHEHKYLGMVLDRKLTWTSHIKHVQKKCEKGMNMLRCVANTKQGSDPKIALMFYRAYIRSIVDYGCVLYGSSSSTNLTSIDRIQYRAIRISIGAIRSSPCPAILAEAQEPPLYIRRQFLACKMLVKKMRFSSDGFTDKICSLSVENLTNYYWRIKNSPPLAEAFIEMKSIGALPKTDKFPIYHLNLQEIVLKPIVIIPQYSETPRLNNNLIKTLLSGYKPNVEIIYTDGSKTELGTGCAFYVSSTKMAHKVRISNDASIYTAEIYAIERALLWITSNRVSESIILSDSKSALDSISHPIMKKYDNVLLCNIRRHIHTIISSSGRVRFVWVKGHAGILGNELVDRAAKEATQLSEKENIYTSLDLIAKLKKIHKDKWRDNWHNYTIKSNNPYTLIHPILPMSIPHIELYTVPRFYAVTITRLKLNHGSFPAHLFRIGAHNTRLCTCDDNSVADLNHLFFACKNHVQETENLLSTLTSLNIQLPVNITSLLARENKLICDALIRFVVKSKIII
ncbi:uncharacterized protein [Leptinotarsa decemlineata]|uniref:uncharacterized protein n=1 Tax=Leptinotarsa decemlineata TaxID=7539 RepID=UPI003D3091EF